MRVHARPPLPLAGAPDRRPVPPVAAPVPLRHDPRSAAGGRDPLPPSPPNPRPIDRVEALYHQYTAEALVEPRFFRVDTFV